MAGLREKVDGLDGAWLVVFAEVSEVSGEGGWVAADIEDAGDLGAHEGIEEFLIAAFAWGIDDGEAGFAAFLQPFWQPDFGFGGGKVGVGEAVFFRGAFGVADGLANAVDAMEKLVFVGDEAADGADAAVKIEDGGVWLEGTEHVLACGIEDFCLGGVDLEKRCW